jgi:large repetitive protein
VQLLLTELQKAPAVLRLSYVADLEDPALVEQRVEAVKRQIEDSWMQLNCCYRLEIEPEVFWRLGAPPDVPRPSRR